MCWVFKVGGVSFGFFWDFVFRWRWGWGGRLLVGVVLESCVLFWRVFSEDRGFKILICVVLG